MISAMNNGISGLNSFERAISVESNNVSNTTTIGHKRDEVTFEDLIYKKGTGTGVSIQTINKNFFQGEVQLTNVNLDVAIEGKGFFIVNERSTGDTFYTRAGSFQQGEDGFLETQEGYKVVGLSPQEINIVSTDSNDTLFTNDFNKNVTSLDIKSGTSIYNYNIKTTDFYSSAVDDTVSGDNYKTASSKINDVELLKNNFIEKLKLVQADSSAPSVSSTTQISQVDFSSQLSQLNDQNDYLQVTIDGNVYREYFDTDLQTTLTNLSDRLSNTLGYTSSIDTNTGVLTIENLIPGKEFFILEANINEEYIPVSKLQEAQAGSGIAMLDSARDALKNAVENADAKYLEITSILSLEENSTIATDEINLRLNALGLVENTLGEVSISDDGLVYVTNENNSFLVSKIQTAHFRNEQGLEPIGSNLFQATTDAGPVLNADNLNTLVSNALETGNSTYNNTLTKLVFYQKAFEANSKSITVSDEFLQTAIEMKK